MAGLANLKVEKVHSFKEIKTSNPLKVHEAGIHNPKGVGAAPEEGMT